MTSNVPEQDPRIYFAAERTRLAWIRTGLALMGFGFVVARFAVFLQEFALLSGRASPPGSSRWFGIALIALGIVLTAAAFASHVGTVRRLSRGEPFVGRPSWMGGVLTALLVLTGILMIVYLFASVQPASPR